MPRGIHARGDVITQLADGTDANVIWRELQEAMDVINQPRDNLRGLFSYPVHVPGQEVLQAWTGADFEVATEYGVPVSVRPDTDTALLGYKFDWFDLATRFTWRFLADASADQVRAAHNTALEADNRLVFKAVMGAMFNNTARLNENAQPVLPLYDADGWVPPEHQGETFAGSHNHYVTTASATLTSAAIDSLMGLVREHGYGEAVGTGRLLLFAHPNQADIIRGFRVASGSKFDFIPASGAPPYLTTETLVGERPPATFGTVSLVGAYGPAWVAEHFLIPKGYVLAVVSNGANSPYNPVAFREHPTSSLRGLRQIGGDKSYPLTDSFYVRGMGTGVRHRGAAAVLQVTTNATYAAPAAFAGAA